LINSYEAESLLNICRWASRIIRLLWNSNFSCVGSQNTRQCLLSYSDSDMAQHPPSHSIFSIHSTIILPSTPHIPPHPSAIPTHICSTHFSTPCICILRVPPLSVINQWFD